MNSRAVFILFMLLFFAPPSFAWNAMGHRIIGEIAYTHLTPSAKARADQLVNYLADAYPYSSSFQTANAWADYIKQDDVHMFDAWHFYNKPLSIDNTPVAQPPTQNLLWAFNHAMAILKSSKSNQFEKAFFLRFLLHLTGDAHQPLHCINRFSQHLPDGDRGGNLFPIQNPSYHNLHAYWDDGLGLFDEPCGLSKSKSRRAACLAQKIQQVYPESFFAGKAANLNPEDWINESFAIAANTAYQTPENAPLSAAYIKNGQVIIEQQIALSGYRLAHLLNSLFG